ncbi:MULTISPECIES: hypothetical protein [unclassified Halomonas]|uniref:hypothetical protein n=1 Tax=unclassified Halomonas TaxID=2609666 RepID=UPI00125E2EB9|nr:MULTISPECIES: hypothetical protein [unclassified Halomonas]
MAKEENAEALDEVASGVPKKSILFRIKDFLMVLMVLSRMVKRPCAPIKRSCAPKRGTLSCVSTLFDHIGLRMEIGCTWQVKPF